MWWDLSGRAAHLAAANMIWRVAANAHTTDWKRNAGAQMLVDRHRVTIGHADPPNISTNVRPWCIDLGDQKLFLMPDRMLVFQGGRYGAVEYDALGIRLATECFVESGPVPQDARIVGSTYLYVNKNGTPDRRFANNREIPIAEYARLELTSRSGLNIHLQVSSIAAAQALAGFRVSRQASGATPGNQGQRWSSSTGTGAAVAPGSRSVPHCYTVLGVMPGCTRDAETNAYRSLARKYHPDLLTNLPPDLVALAEERMREINAAYTEIRRLNGW